MIRRACAQVTFRVARTATGSPGGDVCQHERVVSDAPEMAGKLKNNSTDAAHKQIKIATLACERGYVSDTL